MLAISICVKNNLSRNCDDTAIWSPTADSDYNSSSTSGVAIVQSPRVNTVSPWYNGGASDADIFVDVANKDFHIKSSSIFYNVGANLSADAYCPFSDDIDGTNRDSNWDLGADEAPSSNIIPLIVAHRAMQEMC